MLLYQIGGSLVEQRKHVFVDLIKICDDLVGRCSNDILWLRNTDSLQLDSSLGLDLLDQ